MKFHLIKYQWAYKPREVETMGSNRNKNVILSSWIVKQNTKIGCFLAKKKTKTKGNRYKTITVSPQSPQKINKVRTYKKSTLKPNKYNLECKKSRGRTVWLTWESSSRAKSYLVSRTSHLLLAAKLQSDFRFSHFPLGFLLFFFFASFSAPTLPVSCFLFLYQFPCFLLSFRPYFLKRPFFFVFWFFFLPLSNSFFRLIFFLFTYTTLVYFFF